MTSPSFVVLEYKYVVTLDTHTIRRHAPMVLKVVQV